MARSLLPQHARLIECAVERFSPDSDVEAIVVGGSVAHGLARPDSDVDFMFVLEEDALARRPEPTFADLTLADYEGGYADVKLISRAFVAAVAERGSEPARWAFEGAFVAWSRGEPLEPLLAAAATFPEPGREQRIRDFVGHATIGIWFLSEAAKRDDRYLTAYGASRVALWAGRAVLAHNRRLYPFHKWFLTELARCDDRPDDLPALVDELLRAPSVDAASALVGAASDCVGVHSTISEGANSFLRLTELAWRDGAASFDDC